MMRRVWSAMALAVLAFAAPAYADDTVWEAGVTSAGGPRLSVLEIESADSVQVFRCPSGADCEALPFAGPFSLAGGQPVDLSAAVPGDVFEARSSQNGSVVQTDRTPAWLGNYALTRAPAVVGPLTEGAVVSADAGAWSGGWDRPWNGGAFSRLVACQRPDGIDCVEFSPFHPTVLLSARFAGWYVFAIGQTGSGHTNDHSVTDYICPPYPNPIAPIGGASATRAVSAAFGPVIAASTPTPAPAPAASIRAKALRGKHGLSVARVTCSLRCGVRLTVSGGGKALSRSFTVTGTKALTIPPRHGRLKVRVVIDGKTVASGTSKAR
jgi:hypothetical protein